MESNPTTRSNSTTLNGALAAMVYAALAASSCKKEQVGLFELTDLPLYGSAAEKDKQKTNAQYISILHTNLFQVALSSSDIFEIDEAFRSIGDQELAREILISNFFNESGVQIPTAASMNNDLDTFIEETYKRFFVRLPNEAEKTYVRNFIVSNPQLTPEHIYFAFAMSNEYQFY